MNQRSAMRPFSRDLGARSLLTLLIFLTGSIAVVSAASPPQILNFQGVLRDAGGVPATGSLDMTFRYFDAPTAGNEIIVEAHLAAGTGAVVVDDGLFNVVLGTGALSDGAAVLPGDPYLLLDQVFGDFAEVWLEIQIVSGMGPEVLSPRVRFASSAYALNAGQLAGKGAAEFLDISASAQGKAGDLSVGDLTAAGNDIRFGSPGARIEVNPVTLQITAGDADGDDLLLVGGDSLDDGYLYIPGGEGLSMRSGNGSFHFWGDTGLETARLNSFGFFLDGTMVADELRAEDGYLTFGSGAQINATDTMLTLNAGFDDGDNLVLHAGDTWDDGALIINGDGYMDLRSGNGMFNFTSQVALTVTELARLDPSGNLQIDGDFTVSGSQIQFGAPGAFMSATDALLEIQAGNADTDTLFLSSGNGLEDGSLSIFGGSAMELLAGNGSFSFVNGATSIETAVLDPSGHLQIDGDLTVSGNDITAATNLDLNSGPGSTNFVTIQANGNAFTHFDFDNNSNSVVSWCVNGSCIAPGTQMQLDESGNLKIGGTLSQNQFDLAESYLMGEPLEAGDVVRLHPRITGAVLRSAGADDATVLGVVSERPGVLLGGAPFGADRLEQMWGPGMKARFLEERDRLNDLARSRDVALTALAGPGPEAGGNAPPASADEEAVAESKALQAFYTAHFAPVALAGRVPVKVDTQFGDIAAGDPLSPSPLPGVAMRSDGSGPVLAIALEPFSGGRGKVEAFIARGSGPSDSARAAQQRVTEQIEARTPDPVTGIQSVAGHLQVVLDRDEDDEGRFSIFRDGEEARLASEVFRVDEQGNVFAKGVFRPNAMDLAELFAVSARVEEGDVLVADPKAPGRYKPCDEAGDPAVVGVVAGRPGVLLGSGFDRMASMAPDLASLVEEARRSDDRAEEARAWRRLEARFLETHAPVGLAGTVQVKVDAGYGAVRAGDLLTTSPTPGHAMRADDPRPGIVVGKALESIESGTGLIRMLVMPR